MFASAWRRLLPWAAAAAALAVTACDVHSTASTPASLTYTQDAHRAYREAMEAFEAKDWEAARAALRPLADERLTQRVCTLLARIEGEEFGDKGRVREWLARAVNAPRDPAWTADGYVSDKWLAVSPVTGAFDVFHNPANEDVFTV